MPKVTICNDINSPCYGMPLEENTESLHDGAPVSTRGVDLKANVDKLNDERAKAKDIRGKYVLVSRRFSYFGERAPSFPVQLASLRFPARFHRVSFSEEEEAALLRFLVRLPRGVLGRPRGWRKDDVSWRQGRARCG